MRIRRALAFSALIAVAGGTTAYKGKNVDLGRELRSNFSSLRLFLPAEDRGAIIISALGNVDFLVTDPLGRMVGIDPVTKAEITEMPDASYSVESIGYDDPPASDRSTPETRLFETLSPLEGLYRIEVHGAPGTEYTLTILSYDIVGDLKSKEVETRTIGAQGTVTHLLNYSPQPNVVDSNDDTTSGFDQGADWNVYRDEEYG